jgi:predicted ATP-grasp superfamily ATP-dependent carboligase
MKSVLVLDANMRSALAVTRSLGKHGIRVFTADESVSSLSGSSRYSELYFQHPSARYEEDEFISAINEICLKHQIDILMPVTELTSGLLLIHRTLFGKTIIPFSDIATVNTLANKCKLMDLAKKLDIPVPPTLEINAGVIPIKEISSREFPQVLKPGLSWLKTDSGWIHTSVRVPGSQSEAIRLIEEDPAFQNHNYLLQEYVTGHGEGIFAIYNNGEPITFFAHKRIREKPPDGGVSVLSESADIDSTLLGYAKKILDHVNWHGVAMVEFRVDDGSIYLMEVNTRFWGSLQLAIDSGVDFPWLLYQIACGEKIEKSNEYEKGNRLRWLIGDIKRLLLVLKDNKWSFGEKFIAVISFFTPHPFITHFEIIRYSDLNPFYWEIRRNISKIINRKPS